MQNTPQIVVAREAGACYGVNRALDLVREAAEGEGGPIHTLGPLIHNPTVVAELESKGVGVVESPEEVSGGTIVLRTHGVPPAEEKSAREAADRVLDATCPFVLRAHKAAERLDAEGYQVIVFGEAGHPEVLGTLGHAREPLVIEDPSQLEGVEVGRKVGVVVQTTQSRARLRELVCALLGRADEVRVIDTICEATSLRQAAAGDVAEAGRGGGARGPRRRDGRHRRAQLRQHLPPRADLRRVVRARAPHRGCRRARGVELRGR